MYNIIITKKEEEEADRGGRKRENEKKEKTWGNSLRGNFSPLLKCWNKKKKI